LSSGSTIKAGETTHDFIFIGITYDDLASEASGEILVRVNNNSGSAYLGINVGMAMPDGGFLEN
jgi:hypothetical protein